MKQATHLFEKSELEKVVLSRTLQLTIEEKIDAMLEDKARLAGAVITGGGEGWITELDNDHLLELFSLGLS